MRVERCSKCDGNDPKCFECEGSGEVAIYTAKEIKEMRAKFEKLRLPDFDEPLTQQQQDRFVDLVVKPGVIKEADPAKVWPLSRRLDAGVLLMDEDPVLEAPNLREWECGACGNIMTRALQPEVCCMCGVKFLYS